MQVLARRVLTFLRSFYACSQKYKKVWHFLRKTLDICLRFGYNNTRRQGHGPRRKEYADVAELADALDSGSSSLKRVWVQIPSSAPKSSNVCSGIFCFSDLFGMTSTPLRRWRFALLSYRYSNSPGPALEPELYDFMAIPHNSKCRYGERGAAAAKPKAQIILCVLSSILATQMPCRSRRSGA